MNLDDVKIIINVKIFNAEHQENACSNMMLDKEK
jgi:uncharacterized protein Smg (DUF494 family)